MPSRSGAKEDFGLRCLGTLATGGLAVGPLADRAGRPVDPVGGPSGGGWIERLNGRVGLRAELDGRLSDGADLAAQAALPRAAELGPLGVPAGLADAGEIRQQGRHVLEIVDRRAKRLVALQEAIEHRAAHHAQVCAAPLGGDATVEVMPGGERPELLEQRGDRAGGLRQHVLGGGTLERAGEATEALDRLAAGQVQLAVAAVLGRVEGHAGTLDELLHGRTYAEAHGTEPGGGR